MPSELGNGETLLGEFVDRETVTAARVRALGIDVPAERGIRRSLPRQGR